MSTKWNIIAKTYTKSRILGALCFGLMEWKLSCWSKVAFSNRKNALDIKRGMFRWSKSRPIVRKPLILGDRCEIARDQRFPVPGSQCGTQMFLSQVLSEIGRKVKRRNGETELFISLWLLICEKCVALPTANARRWLTMTSMILMKCCVSRQLEGVSGKCSWRWVCEKTLGSDTLTPTLFVPNIHDCDIRIIGIPTYAIGSIVLDP